MKCYQDSAGFFMITRKLTAVSFEMLEVSRAEVKPYIQVGKGNIRNLQAAKRITREEFDKEYRRVQKELRELLK